MEYERAKDLMLEGLTPSQAKAAEALLGNDNVFLTGDAGTGKSFLLDRYIEFLDRVGCPHLVMAPTGVAALNVRGGVTMHRALNIPPGVVPPDAAEKKGVPKVLRAADVVIVDEISMCRVDIFEYMIRLVQRREGDGGLTKIVLCGDFYQLPPVITNKDLDAFSSLFPGNPHGWPFKSNLWRGRAFRPCVLTDVVRQSDPTFVAMLDRARRGDGSCIPYFNRRAKSSRAAALNASRGEAIFLCSRNAEAEKLNEEKLEALGKPVYTYCATVVGTVSKGERIADDEIRLCKGARVMAICNEAVGEGEEGSKPRQPRYVNGSRGYVRGFKGLAANEVLVEFDDHPGKLVAIGPKTWAINKSVAVEKVDDDGNKFTTVDVEPIGTIKQIPLKLAYAVTIHKSQGMTFDSCVVNSTVFTAGQLYVGLSRCSSIEGLTIYPKIADGRLKSSPEVNEFYDSLTSWVSPEERQAKLDSELSPEGAPLGPRTVPGEPDMVDLRLPYDLAAMMWQAACQNWGALQESGVIPADLACPAAED